MCCCRRNGVLGGGRGPAVGGMGWGAGSPHKVGETPQVGQGVSLWGWGALGAMRATRVLWGWGVPEGATTTLWDPYGDV